MQALCGSHPGGLACRRGPPPCREQENPPQSGMPPSDLWPARPGKGRALFALLPLAAAGGLPEAGCCIRASGHGSSCLCLVRSPGEAPLSGRLHGWHTRAQTLRPDAKEGPAGRKRGVGNPWVLQQVQSDCCQLAGFQACCIMAAALREPVKVLFSTAKDEALLPKKGYYRLCRRQSH